MTKTERDRTWIPAISSVSRSLRGNCKKEAKSKRKNQYLRRLSSTETEPLQKKKIVAMGCIKKKKFNMEVRQTAGRHTEADIAVSVFKKLGSLWRTQPFQFLVL